MTGEGETVAPFMSMPTRLVLLVTASACSVRPALPVHLVASVVGLAAMSES